MNRAQACTLIQQTFAQAFDKARFRNYALNLLNHIDDSKASAWNSQYVKDAFKDHVRRYERLGTYTSPDKDKLDVLIVHLTTESKLERARTAIRNFVADHLKTRDEKDAALVAFVSPSEATWRFSYVKMEYATVEKDSGKVGVETRLTPARRFSYIVGEGESCHTAQTRFIDLLRDTETDPTLTDIEEAFSVEAVTKEFFNKYVELFEKIHKALEKIAKKDKTIHKEFKAKGVNTVDFAKKLMGQIVFLYFLQKKGWLGVAKGQDWGSGPHDFLRRLANSEHVKYDNFFNDILEPLFYDTLATDRGHDAWCNRFKCRIPFLNGGLFEPPGDYDWRKTDIILPNRLFTNSEYVVKEDITGTGVLDVFDRYNFTVNESEPLEKEVAIDPEMLGKVFENLIEANRRKGLGAYYTPREIVHYMCQECLINYLDTAINAIEESVVPVKPKQNKMFGESEPEQMALKTTVRHEIVPRADIETFVHLGEQISHYEAVDTKYRIRMPKSIEKHARALDDALKVIMVCDPAIGSGAFPVGMMSEIVRARCALTPYFNDVAERTAYYFKRHAIQNSLYGVDIDPGAVEIAKLRLWLSLVVDEEDTKQIKPLPNLDYKIVVGNSLLGVEKTLFNEILFRQLEKLKPLYFDESDKTKKDKYRTEIDKLIHQLTNGKRVFDFEIYFSEVFHMNSGFDVVLANPPYVGEKSHKDMFRTIRSGPLAKFYQAKMDLFYFFFHLSLNFGRMGSQVAFITTNYYITATGARTLRRDFSARSTINRLVNFNELKIFESAQGQHNMVTLLSKSGDKSRIARTCITKRSGIASHDILYGILSGDDDENEYYAVPQSDLYDGNEYYIRLTGRAVKANGDPVNRILSRLSEYKRLDDFCNINSGCDITVSRITKRYLKNFRGDFVEGDGVFVLNPKEVLDLQLGSNESGKLKNFIKNSDIQKYGVDIGDNKLVYFRWEDDIEQYPTLKRHLKRFKSILLDQSRRYEEDYPWFALHRPRNQEIFDSEQKILVPYRSKSNIFGYSVERIYSSRDVFFISSKDKRATSLKYALALLNSKLYYLWLYHRGKRKGETLELYHQPLSEIPLKQVSISEQKAFISLVDQIIAAKQRDPECNTTALEREIDRLVYDLYGLTAEEITIVEGSTRGE